MSRSCLSEAAEEGNSHADSHLEKRQNGERQDLRAAAGLRPPQPLPTAVLLAQLFLQFWAICAILQLPSNDSPFLLKLARGGFHRNPKSSSYNKLFSLN